MSKTDEIERAWLGRKTNPNALPTRPSDDECAWLIARIHALEAAIRALLDDPETAPIYTDARIAAALLLEKK